MFFLPAYKVDGLFLKHPHFLQNRQDILLLCLSLCLQVPFDIFFIPRLWCIASPETSLSPVSCVRYSGMHRVCLKLLFGKRIRGEQQPTPLATSRCADTKPEGPGFIGLPCLEWTTRQVLLSNDLTSPLGITVQISSYFRACVTRCELDDGFY